MQNQNFKTSVLFVSIKGRTKKYLITSSQTMLELRNFFGAKLDYNYRQNTFSVSL